MPSTLFSIPPIVLVALGIALTIPFSSFRKKETMMLYGSYFLCNALLGIILIYSIPHKIVALEYFRGYALYFTFFLLSAAWNSVVFPAKKVFKQFRAMLVLGLVTGTLYALALASYTAQEQTLLMESLWNDGLWNWDFVVIKISMILIVAATTFEIYFFLRRIVVDNLAFLHYIRDTYSYVERPLISYKNTIISASAFIFTAYLVDVLVIFNNSTWAMIVFAVYQLLYAYIVLIYVFDFKNFKKIESPVTIYFKNFMAENRRKEHDVFFPPNAVVVASQDGLSNEKRSELCKKVIVYFVESKPYRHKKLTMTDIAKAINTNRTYISQIINVDFKTDFYNFVNVLRIEDAKSKIKSNPNHSLTFVANDCGFGSYATFTKYYRMYKDKSAEWYMELANKAEN